MKRRDSLNYSSFLLILLLLFLPLLFLSCGNSQRVGDSLNSLGAIPSKWSKYLAAGTVSATLDVYRNNGKHVLTQPLNVDLTNNLVTADPFSLPTGDTYRFLITFYFTLSNGDAIPYAYADFKALIDELSEQVQFSENDIRYSYDTSNPEVTASISDGLLPNLDNDSDGWNNWEELRDKANPQDGNSIPQNPKVTITGKQDGSANTATITVTATDNSRVEDLKLIDPICGVTVLGDSSTNNSDGTVTRTLSVRLDLMSVGANPRLLQALASDGVTQSQNANATLEFAISGNGSQPYFVFTDPPNNGELEGPVAFKGIACSRSSINVSTIKFLNQEINQFGFTGEKNEQTGDYLIQSAAVDTTLLADGRTTLNIELQDNTSKKGSGSGVFEVVNDSPIKIVSPVGRRWVFGNDTIAVSVKNLPDSNLVLIEGDSNFELTSSNSGGAVGMLHVSNLVEGSVIPLTMKAVRGDGTEVTRTVEFVVRNQPQIEIFQPTATTVFKNWGTRFNYRIVNVDPNELYIANDLAKDLGPQSCSEDPIAKGVNVCSGSVDAPVSSSQSFELYALRPLEQDENCDNCEIIQNTSIQATTQLSNDIPFINVAIDGDDEAEAPEKITFPNESPTKYYRLIMTNQREGTIDFQKDTQSGQSFSITGLEPRTDYLATIQVLNTAGGNVVSEMFRA